MRRLDAEMTDLETSCQPPQPILFSIQPSHLLFPKMWYHSLGMLKFEAASQEFGPWTAFCPVIFNNQSSNQDSDVDILPLLASCCQERSGMEYLECLATIRFKNQEKLRKPFSVIDRINVEQAGKNFREEFRSKAKMNEREQSHAESLVTFAERELGS